MDANMDDDERFGGGRDMATVPDLSAAQHALLQDMIGTLQEDLEGFLASSSKNKECEFHHDLVDLIALTLDRSFRKHFFHTLTSQKGRINKLSLYFYFDRLIQNETFVNVVTLPEILECALQLGGVLNGLVVNGGSIDYLEATYGMQPHAVIFLSAILAPLKSLQRIHLEIGGTADFDIDGIAHFRLSLERHPSLQEVKIWGLDQNAIGEVCQALATMTSLKTACVNGRIDHSGHHTTVTAVEVAIAMARVCALPSLEELYFSHIHFDNLHVTNLLCSGLNVSHAKTLGLSVVTFPADSSEVVAHAIARSKVSTFNYELLERGHGLLDAMKTAFAALTKKMELCLGGFPHYLTSSQVIHFLRDSQHLRLYGLEIHFKGWSKEVEDALAYYIKNNSCLRALLVDVQDTNGPDKIPEAILSAVDSGTRCLEEVKFFIFNLKKEWMTVLEPILALNRYRHDHEDLYLSIGKAKCDSTKRLLLIQALESADTTLSILLDVLRRNEWNLITLIRQYGSDRDVYTKKQRLA